MDSDSFNSWIIWLNPSPRVPISSFETTGMRTSKFPWATFFIANSKSCNGLETLPATNTDSPIDIPTPTMTKKIIILNRPHIMGPPTVGSADSKAEALIYEPTPTSIKGTRLIIRKTMRRRFSTLSLKVPWMWLSSPLGKNRAISVRQILSQEKKTKTVVREPPTKVIPINIRRPSEIDMSLIPNECWRMAGWRKPNRNPARSQARKFIPTVTGTRLMAFLSIVSTVLASKSSMDIMPRAIGYKGRDHRLIASEVITNIDAVAAIK